MTTVEIRLLGPFELSVAGSAIELRRPKQRALLALLALHAREVVSTDRLVDGLWGEAPPKTALSSLQNLVSELRKALPPDVLLTRPPGYTLDVDRELVDAHRFERLVREGQAERLREALALWRGPPLSDLTLEPFAQGEIARLEALRAAAREELFQAELALGRHAQIVPELEAFVADHPFRERPRGQLMLALYRSGRQADALEAYRRARETLVGELGLEPSSALQDLEQAILRHDPAVDFERRVPPPAEPERRKTVTILFVDVVDSSALAAERDPEVLRGVMRAYFDVVRTVVERHGGSVEKFIGDAAMAAFGIPELHEDDALRAIRAASELSAALGRLNVDLDQAYGITLEIRIGLNTGEVLATDPSAGESFATGQPVNVAMRLEQAALPGEVLLGEATYRLVSHAVETEPIEPLDLGPALGQIPAFRLVGIGDGTRPPAGASLVGRGDELAWLRAAFAGACAERRSRVVTVLGEAGVGKTRLASELTSGLAGEATTLVGRCVSYGQGATFLPLLEIVRQAAPTRPRQAITDLFAGDEQAPLIAERITQLAAPADGAAPIGELFWAVRRFLEALALRRPLVVVLEDLHWAEPTLLDLVEYLAAWTADAPLLVLGVARPELLEQRPGWGTRGKWIRLEPLGRDEAEALVDELAGAELAPEARTRIIEVAEGNPLFLEQLLAFTEEVGADALASVPPTVEALLAGRIERLEPDERALLERAAVAGREFGRSAIVHLSPPDELAAIDRCLGTLVRRGLVETGRWDGGEAFRFHHALIRDVAYAGITKEARTDLHERYGSWLEQRAEDTPEIVGYHFEQAHRFLAELHPGDAELRALAKRAGDRLAEAGIRAWKRADAPAAVNLLGRAAALLAPDDPRSLEALCELGIAQRSAGELESGDNTLSEVVARAEELGDRRMALRARIELAHVRLFTDREADPGELVALVNQANPVFEELGDDRALGRAWRHLGYVRGSMEGRCTELLEASEKALTYYRRSGWSASGCLLGIAVALFYGPTAVPEGTARCEQLLEETTDQLGRAHVTVYLGGFRALAGRVDDALATLAEADTIYRELADPYSQADNSGRIRGLVHLLTGDAEAAEQAFRTCCETFERAHDEAAASSAGSQLGEAFYRQDRYAEAAEWCRFAREHAPAGDLIAQLSWRGLNGKLLARQGLHHEGEEEAAAALRIVERTDLLTHRGQALLDLAHVLCIQGRENEAARRIEQARELFQRKGNVASDQIAESLLADVAVV